MITYSCSAPNKTPPFLSLTVASLMRRLCEHRQRIEQLMACQAEVSHSGGRDICLGVFYFMFEYQNDSCLSQNGVNIVCLFALVPIFGDVWSMNTYQTVCLVYFGSGIR